MALDPTKASRMALYAGDVENLFTSLLSAVPAMPGGVPVLPVEVKAPMALLAFGDWEIAGQLRCDDDLSLVQDLRKLVGAGQSSFFYGFLLRRTTPDPTGDFAIGDYLALVRGTMQPIEWLLDLLALPDLLNGIEHHIAGLVPSGFISIYESMTLVAPDGRTLGPAPRAIGDIVNGTNRPLTVVGHSLGAVLSVYLTLDLAAEVATPEQGLDSYFVACPQPGTSEFASAFRQRVANYNVVNWWRDIVPQAPPIPYITLLNGTTTQNVKVLMPKDMDPQAIPPDNPGENHHAVNYALLLDPGNQRAAALVDWRGGL